MSKEPRVETYRQRLDKLVVEKPCVTIQPNLFVGEAPPLNIIGTPKHRVISPLESRKPYKQQIHENWEIDSLQRGQTFYDYVKQNMNDCWEAHADKLPSLKEYMDANWLDHINIRGDGCVEFKILLRDMIVDRVHMLDKVILLQLPQYSGRPIKPYLFYGIVHDEFLKDTDQDYVNAISELMENVIAKMKGRVIVVKGIADTNMRPCDGDHLEYHWVPGNVGSSFKT
jgi:hypothetical protein